MREDVLLEEIIKYLCNIKEDIAKFCEYCKGMWQTKEEEKYPDSKGLGFLAGFFIVLAVFLAIPTSLILYVNVSLANIIFLCTLLYFMMFFSFGSLLAILLDIYIHNKFKSKFLKIPLSIICSLLLATMLPFIVFFYFAASIIVYFNLTMDIFTAASGILGIDIIVISVIGILFQYPFDKTVNEGASLLGKLSQTEIKFLAIILFALIIIISFLIKNISKIFDWLLFRKRLDSESRKKSLNLIYIAKIAILIYIFGIITFTGSFEEDIEDHIINVITLITLIILIKDKMISFFLQRREAHDFNIQIEWKNNKEEKKIEDETLIETSDEHEEAIEEMVEEEEPIEQEEIKETIVESPQIFYDSSTIKQPSYRYIRTHKLPDNRKIYRLRKERIGKIFLPK